MQSPRATFGPCEFTCMSTAELGVTGSLPRHQTHCRAVPKPVPGVSKQLILRQEEKKKNVSVTSKSKICIIVEETIAASAAAAARRGAVSLAEQGRVPPGKQCCLRHCVPSPQPWEAVAARLVGQKHGRNEPLGNAFPSPKDIVKNSSLATLENTVDCGVFPALLQLAICLTLFKQLLVAIFPHGPMLLIAAAMLQTCLKCSHLNYDLQQLYLKSYTSPSLSTINIVNRDKTMEG